MEGTDKKMSVMKRTVMMLVCLLWLFGGISLSARTEKKAVAMWVDAHSNLSRFATKEDVKTYIKRLKQNGFNTIYLDVKPLSGFAMYKSSLLPPLKSLRGRQVDRDWDYLGYWLKQAHAQGMKLYACVATLGFGSPSIREGVVYQDARWNGKTQMKMKNHQPDSLKDVRDEKKADAAFLNPVLPEVQEFVTAYIHELAENYPRLDGICLDYCRWWDGEYGMSDATIAGFGRYAHLPQVNRNDILTRNGGMGPLFAQWTEYRSMTIARLIRQIKTAVKSANPKAELHLWAGTDWESRYPYGQNWASKRFVPRGEVYTPGYAETSFIADLDVFIIGVYSVYAWTEEYPGTVWWAVEAAMDRYPEYIKGDCKVYGSIQAYENYAKKKGNGLADACTLCLDRSDGLMVFEIGHVENKKEWGELKEGIQKSSAFKKK